MRVMGNALQELQECQLCEARECAGFDRFDGVVMRQLNAAHCEVGNDMPRALHYSIDVSDLRPENVPGSMDVIALE